MEEILNKWGWAGVLCLFVLRDLWPFFSKTIFPNLTKREEEEQRWRHNLDERQAKTLEEISKTLSGLVISGAVQNERFANFIEAQTQHNALITSAIGDMRETVAKAHSAKEPVTQTAKRKAA